MAEESEDEAYSDENGDDDEDYDGSEYSSDNDLDSRALEKQRSNSNFGLSGSDFKKNRGYH